MTDQVPAASSSPPTERGGAVRVASVDDDTVIRHGLPLLLQAAVVVDSFASAEDLLSAAPAVDVVLLDLELNGTGASGGLQRAEAVHAVVEAGYRVLVYTNERRRRVLVNCIAAGAAGVIHKAEPMTSVDQAIGAVADGRTVITQALIGLAELAERRGELETLSPRQREILSARARGETFQSIADRLFLSKRTVEDHMNAVTEKFADYLQTHSAADLERYLGLGPEDGDDPGVMPAPRDR